jgi:hypothetical protein
LTGPLLQSAGRETGINFMWRDLASLIGTGTQRDEILPENPSFDDYAVGHDNAGAGKTAVVLNARMIKQRGVQPNLILLVMEEITAGGDPVG